MSRAAAPVRRIPLALRILLLVALVHGLAWSVATAPLEGPDELAHAAYAQQLAETGHAPSRNGGDGTASAAMGMLWMGLNLGPIIGHPEGRPFWSRVGPVSREADRQPMDNGSGPNPAGNYPPLYYAYAAAAYRLSPDTGLLARLWVMRFAGVLLFVAAVGFAWLVAAELLRATWQRVLATAVVALQPKLGFMAGVINPDIMLVAIGTATLWVGLRTGQRGVTLRRAIALGVLAGAAAFCHPRGLFLPPFAVLAVIVGLIRMRPPLRTWRTWVTPVVVCGVPALIGVVAAVAWTRAHAAGAAFGTGSPVAGFNLRQFLSYVWQFYLPGVDGMAAKVGPAYGYRQVFVESYFGSFASLETNYPLWVYGWLQVGVGLLGIATFAVAVRRTGVLVTRWPAVVLGAAFCLALMALLHVVSYGSLRGSTGGGGDPVITGRYLLPMVSLFGCATAWVTGALPRRLQPLVAGAVVGAFVLLAISGLGITAVRFDG